MRIAIAISNELYGDIFKNIFDEVLYISQKNDLTYENLKKFNPQYIFLPHWSHIIPKEIYDNFECVIFHMTDLPFGRGGSPLQNLISREVYNTKISAIKCVKELDAGPIYLKQDLNLDGNANEIYKRTAFIVLDMIKEIVEKKPVPIEQQGDKVVFTRRKPEESNIEKLETLNKAYDYIRMLDADGYPKAFVETEFFKFEFSQATLNSDKIIANVEIKLKKDNND